MNENQADGWRDCLNQDPNQDQEYRVYRNYVVKVGSGIKLRYKELTTADDPDYLFRQKPIASGFAAYLHRYQTNVQDSSIDLYKEFQDYFQWNRSIAQKNHVAKLTPIEKLRLSADAALGFNEENFKATHLQSEIEKLEQSHRYFEETTCEEDQALKAAIRGYTQEYLVWVKRWSPVSNITSSEETETMRLEDVVRPELLNVFWEKCAKDIDPDTHYWTGNKNRLSATLRDLRPKGYLKESIRQLSLREKITIAKNTFDLNIQNVVSKGSKKSPLDF